MTWITPADARLLEQENGLPEMAVAADREMTAAELAYFSLKPLTPLSFHLEPLTGMNYLVVLDSPEDPEAEPDPVVGVPARVGWDPYLGDKDQRIQAKVAGNWAALAVARSGGLRELMGEDVHLVLTSASPYEGFRWSASLAPGTLKGIYAQAPRWALTGPEFGELPPEGEGQPSPGLAILKLRIARVFLAQSILLQGATTLINHDAAGILRLAQTTRPKT